MNWLNRYNKAILSAIAAMVVIINNTYGLSIDGTQLEQQTKDLIDMIAAILGTLGVYQIRNATDAT